MEVDHPPHHHDEGSHSMDVDPHQQQRNCVSSDQKAVGTASVDIVLHPLVILNVTDHFTRNTVNNFGRKRVIGALLGQQSERKIEIHTSFELIFDEANDETLLINLAYFLEKKAQMLQVFPEFEIMGWYTSGHQIGDKDHVPHKFFTEYNASPLLVLVDCEPPASQRDLPLFCYETLMHYVGESAIISFAKVPYRIESEESERISVDHITHLEAGGGDGSNLVRQLVSMKDAVIMLQQRIRIIHAYLLKVKQGEILLDNAMLRRILSLCHKLPAMDSEKFTEAYLNESQDYQLISYLGLLTKGCNSLNETVDNFNFSSDFRRR